MGRSDADAARRGDAESLNTAAGRGGPHHGDGARSSSISLQGVTKAFDGVGILDAVSLTIEQGEFLSLLGPSGCGKSTLLRIIAGLERQDCGHVVMGGEPVDDTPPRDRDVAMVFQSYALYPHMTVRQNMSLPLRMRRLTRAQRLPLIGSALPGARAIQQGVARDVEDVAAQLGLTALLDRKPGRLSGGQRQRVAVGRALVRRPRVFLMDEPLSNLDAALRVKMRTEFKALHARLGVTIVYVTHDQTEAMAMSDRVAVMLDGAILQVGTPDDIYFNPSHRRVAEFIGSSRINFLPGRIVGPGAVEAAGASFSLETGLAAGTPVSLGVRPEALFLAESVAAGGLTGRVRDVEMLGADCFVSLALNGADDVIVARLPVASSVSLTPGRQMTVCAQPGGVLVFDAEGRRVRLRDAQLGGEGAPS